MISFSWLGFFSFLHTYSLSCSRVKALKRTQALSPSGGVGWTRRAHGPGFKRAESTASWDEGSPRGTAAGPTQASMLHLEMTMCLLLRLLPPSCGPQNVWSGGDLPGPSFVASFDANVMPVTARHVGPHLPTDLATERAGSSRGGSYTGLLPGPGHLTSF